MRTRIEDGLETAMRRMAAAQGCSPHQIVINILKEAVRKDGFSTGSRGCPTCGNTHYRGGVYE